MVKIIGVRFRNAGKVYYFDPKEMDLKRGDRVIVETSRGVECGKIVLSPREIEDDKVVSPLRPVIRIASEEDLERERVNIEKEKEAYRICRQKIREHNLDMKLVMAEYTFDNKKVLFYFTADGRVDFRELVKDLASVFKTRIELRQIGVRDETKLLGGIGICGRPLCCASYLSDFAPVSIKMAKEQNLSLNPTKISGVCGRLMCCLKNEEETYEYLNKKLPGLGDLVETPDGQSGEVQAVNVLRQKVRVLIENGDDKEIADYAAEDIVVIAKKKKGGKQPVKESKETAEQTETTGTKENRDQKENRSQREDRKPSDQKDRRDKKDAGESREGGQKRPEGEARRRRNRGSRRHENAEGESREMNGGEQKPDAQTREGRNGFRRREGRAQTDDARENNENKNSESGNGGNPEKTGRRRNRRNRRRNRGSGAEQKGRSDTEQQN